MSGLNDRIILGEEIESITLGVKKIIIKMENGEKIKCKPVGSMNFTAKMHYKEGKVLKERADDNVITIDDINNFYKEMDKC